MFEMGTSALQIAARTALVYAGVFVGLRVMGKRELGQMNVFDLVVVLLIANAVQNAMTGPDFSLQGGLLAAAVLLAVNRGVSVVGWRWSAWGLLEGTPTVLVQEGQFIDPALRKEKVSRLDIEKAMREHGIEQLDHVRLAVLETDGSISIVPRDSHVIRTRKHVRQFKH
jgi:uncharacterized membrane protein YcaP (DUF421 family)